MNENKIESLSVCPSKEETTEILKCCGRMMGFDYNPDYEEHERKKILCERYNISIEEYDYLLELRQYFENESKCKKKVLKYNSYRSMDYGNDF